MQQRIVTIIQEYVPRYREPFFEALRRELAKSSVILKVAAGKPGPESAEREDSVDTQVDIHIRQKEFRYLGRRFTLRWLPIELWRSDAIIIEQARRNIDTYLLLMLPSIRRRVGLWGHGRDFVISRGKAEQRILQAMSRRAAWLFSYTDAGRTALIESGCNPAIITVVQNSIDTVALQQAVLRYEKKISSDNSDPTVPTACFIGALDETKKLDLLLDAWKIVQRKEERARLLIAGSGVAHDWISETARMNVLNVHLLGYVDDDEKARIAHESCVMVIPGRVGLVALDALVLNLPIITTKGTEHAPEIDYLHEGTDIIFSEPNPQDLARTISKALSERQSAKRSEAVGWSVDDMAKRFSDGLLAMLAKQP
jgi:glycosyltransferase involved in cell wall biosynthesis